jgi:hypothetical protein
MRSAVGQAGNAYNQANQTAANLGGQAGAIGGNLTPFFTAEMMNPQGLGQQGVAAETSAAMGGAGGANAGLVGQAAQRASASRNAGGFQSALDQAARERSKAEAGSAEGIAAQNEQLKESQRQAGAEGLQKMYGTDVSGQLQSQGQEAQDIETEAKANQTGWLQNTLGIINALKPGYASGKGFSMGGGGAS